MVIAIFMQSMMESRKKRSRKKDGMVYVHARPASFFAIAFSIFTDVRIGPG